MESIQLVAIDLDGTLLRTDGSICYQAAEAIDAATQRGVKVVLASGRAPRSVRPIAKALGLTTPQICHNGATIYDPTTDTTILQHTLDKEVAKTVVRVARQASPTAAIGLEIGDNCYTDKSGQRRLAAEPAIRGLGAHTDSNGTKPTPGIDALDPATAAANSSDLGPLAAVLDQPVSKVMMLDEPHRLVGLEVMLREQVGRRISFAFSHLRLLQVVHFAADKGVALEMVAKLYGIERSATMAIGDAPNDTGMIRWAGTGIALYNAWAEVREAAHFVLPSNDSAGVATAIRQFVLMQ